MLVLGAQASVTQAASVVIGNSDSYALSSSFDIFEDTNAALTLEDILQADVQSRFKLAAKGDLSTNFGATHSAIWLRVQLRTSPSAPTRWMLQVANPPLDQLDVYLSNAGSAYTRQSGGDFLPFLERPVPHRHHVKPLDLLPGSASMLYLRIASQGNVSAPTTLWQPAALWKSDQQTYSVFSLYFGLLLGLVAYNLLLFFAIRDRAYLIYVAFAASVGLSQAANAGLGAQFLWPDALWWNNKSINVAYAVSGTFGVSFARTFLSSRQKLPRLDRLMQLQVWLWAATIFMTLLLPHRVAVLTVTGLALVGVLTVVLAGAVSIWHRHPGAQYFGLAWGAFLSGIVILSVHNYGMLPSNPFTANAMLIGSALEMVLLSFALADRINVTRMEKEAAQAQVASEQAVVLALRQSQGRYQAVIEHVGEGMMVMQKGRIVFVNFRATEILEMTKAAIIEEGIIYRFTAGDQAMLLDRVKRRLAGLGVPEQCEIKLAFAGADAKWLEFGDIMVPWDGGQGLLIFFLDVTQRRTAELETRAAMAQQQELNELRSRFVAMTSHEFRTPLATILSAQDLLRNFNDRLPAAQKLEILDMVEASVHRMTRMLERVLLLGQVGAHMLEFQPQRLNLKALCEQLVLEAEHQYANCHCEVVTAFSNDLSDGMYDEKLLRHIFSNLLSNAIKYSPKGGEVRLSVCAQGGSAVFEVSDQGMGIPADEVGHLFASFHRASNVGAIEGTGLGLAIVKQSVELHGGSIEVASKLGQGTRFTVRLKTALTSPVA